jgi:hypothetical protein
LSSRWKTDGPSAHVVRDGNDFSSFQPRPPVAAQDGLVGSVAGEDVAFVAELAENGVPGAAELRGVLDLAPDVLAVGGRLGTFLAQFLV